MEYYFKTDFQIVETFTDSTGVPIDLNNFDFELIYQTTGVNNYKASKKGTTFINCAIDETDSSKLNVIFQNHKLSCGQLHREIKIKVLNSLFEDYQQIMTHPFTEIYLVQNGGDQTTGYASAGIPVVIPFTPSIITDIADTDSFLGISALGIFLQTTWLNIKAKLKTYFDTLFEPKKAATDLYVTQAEKSTWNAKQDALYADVDYLTPTTASATYEPKKGENDNYVTDDEKTVIENTSGENTGDETAESIIDKIGTDGQIKSDYLPSYVDDVIEGYYFEAAFYSDSAHTELITAEQGKIYVDIPTNFSYRYSGSAYINISNPLDYSTNIETDKLSTTKVSAIKTFYDWAVGKFIDLAKIVTTWTATTLDTNIPSEKLVKDSLDLKADITPANGSTSALRALFTSVPEANCVYNTNTGYYEMNGINNLTESDVLKSYYCLSSYRNQSSQGAFQKSQIRTNFYLGYIADANYNCGAWCQFLTTLEVFKFSVSTYITKTVIMFYGCSNLITAETFRMDGVTSSANCGSMFYGCTKLVTAYLKGLRVSFSFKDCPLLSLASLQYLVTNRANGTTIITITVHETVWEKLDDFYNYPEWNALLVDAGTNYINFASA